MTLTLTRRVEAEDGEQDVRLLSGAQKSFLLLISLEESVATRIISYLSDEELRVLRKASEDVKEVAPRTIMALHREFAERAALGAPTSLRGGSAYLRRLAGKALGEGRVASLWTEREQTGGLVNDLEKLSPEMLLGMLEDESPQTVAVVLSQFEPGRAAGVMALLPKEQRGQVLYRMAKLESVPEASIREIEEEFASEILALTSGQDQRRLGGVAAAAQIMKRMAAPDTEGLLDNMQDADTRITDELKRALFTFEDLLRIGGRGMQVLLKEISTDQLLLALRTASDNMREKIFGNLSSRAANMLREELELMGPTRLSEVEAAQRAIVERALALETEGQIRIEREGGGDYV